MMKNHFSCQPNETSVWMKIPLDLTQIQVIKKCFFMPEFMNIIPQSSTSIWKCATRHCFFPLNNVQIETRDDWLWLCSQCVAKQSPTILIPCSVFFPPFCSIKNTSRGRKPVFAAKAVSIARYVVSSVLYGMLGHSHEANLKCLTAETLCSF